MQTETLSPTMRAAPVVGAAVLLGQAVAQTPAGISPSTDVNLGAQYLSTYVEPNILLSEDRKSITLSRIP